MNAIVSRSSEGYDLVGYVSLPLGADPDQDGKPLHPVPLIALIHGGPSDERAQWVFAPLLQWLNNRGFASST